MPTGNFIQFSYVFGSEEYNEWVGSQFNDVFGFFVNGVNYALIPGTSTPVAINDVNNGANSAYYIDNTSAFLDTQMDGLTKVLTLVAPVNSGVTNTMFIGIADAGDKFWIPLSSLKVAASKPVVDLTRNLAAFLSLPLWH